MNGIATFELLICIQKFRWRDLHQTMMFVRCNNSCPFWESDNALSLEECRTGYPSVDACMVKLKQDGVLCDTLFTHLLNYVLLRRKLRWELVIQFMSK